MSIRAQFPQQIGDEDFLGGASRAHLQQVAWLGIQRSRDAGQQDDGNISLPLFKLCQVALRNARIPGEGLSGHTTM